MTLAPGLRKPALTAHVILGRLAWRRCRFLAPAIAGLRILCGDPAVIANHLTGGGLDGP